MINNVTMPLFNNPRFFKWRRKKKFQKKMEIILKRKAFHKIRACKHHNFQKQNMIIEENKKLIKDIFYDLGRRVPLSIMLWLEDIDY